MIIDIHIHTEKYSWCSNIGPKDAIRRAKELGLDGIVLLEHDIVWSEENILRLRDEMNEYDLVILRGQEISCNKRGGARHGHLITFGYYETNHRNFITTEIIDRVHEAGGVAIAAHPYRGGFGFGADIYKLPLDGIEVLHPEHNDQRVLLAKKACEELNLAELGGSDAHEVWEIGSYLTYFPNQISTEEDLITHIKSRMCLPVKYHEVPSCRLNQNI